MKKIELGIGKALLTYSTKKNDDDNNIKGIINHNTTAPHPYEIGDTNPSNTYKDVKNVFQITFNNIKSIDEYIEGLKNLREKMKLKAKFKKEDWVRYCEKTLQVERISYNPIFDSYEYTIGANGNPFNKFCGLFEDDLTPYEPKDGECYISKIEDMEFLNCKKENRCYFINESGSIYLPQNDIEDGEIILRPATKEEEIKIKKAIADQKGEAFVNGKWEKLW